MKSKKPENAYKRIQKQGADESILLHTLEPSDSYEHQPVEAADDMEQALFQFKQRNPQPKLNGQKHVIRRKAE